MLVRPITSRLSPLVIEGGLRSMGFLARLVLAAVGVARRFQEGDQTR